jgi:acyl-CoA synthetase (AMP-forming)/AMP-acid ligase II
LLAALARRRVSMLLGVPTLFVRLLAHLRERGTPLPRHSLRYAYVGGAALELPLKREFEAVFGCAMHHGYGMTEYAGSMFITRVDRPRDDASSGELNEGCEVRLVDPRGSDVPQGEVGEIWIRGTGLMLGYYRAPELSAQAMREGGWFNTGDLGRFDAGGALFVCGRSKDMIIRSGFNVYPAEVEAVLNAHPAIHLAAVFGLRTADGNEDVVAAVELEAGRTLDPIAMRGWLDERLAPYKRPTRWIELPALPLLANGKLARQALLERLREGSA